MYEIAIKSDFASAHFLRGYDGPCKDLHGHTWQVEVAIDSDKLNAVGLVVDFRELKMKLRGFLQHIDHVNLNEILYFRNVNPSTENLAKYIYDEFGKAINPLTIKRVTVWESDVTSVTYYE